VPPSPLAPPLASAAPAPDIRAGRLPAPEYARRFADATPPMKPAQALLEAERCLYCYDAPCSKACPTAIDVPSFIHRIADGNLRGAANAILEANPLGGLCARVCPTETLCEAACVHQTHANQPVAIGRLQRYAVDALMASDQPQLFTRAAQSGKTVAVLGAGPAGLACAHTLARLGHRVQIYDARAKPGGLNEYGIAAYKLADGFAQAEVQWLLGIGGITLHCGWRLDSVSQFETLRRTHDAVFLGLGLAATVALGIPGEQLNGVHDAVDFIARLRQTQDLAQLPIGRRVVVIGGGMTAIDASVQSKLLGAEEVHMVYRRGTATMAASGAEQAWAQTRGVVLHEWLAPLEILGHDGQVSGVCFAEQSIVDGRLTPTGRRVQWDADMVLKAIGQRPGHPVLEQAGLSLQDGRVRVDAHGQTSLPGVWAGGDCRAGGPDLSVQAVQDGKIAAHAMDAHWRSV